MTNTDQSWGDMDDINKKRLVNSRVISPSPQQPQLMLLSIDQLFD